MNQLVVMKFGGTSVEDAVAINRTAGIVRGRLSKGLTPIVVVSAMAKVTDQLLSAANAAGRGDRAGALAITARLRNRHLETACALVSAQVMAELGKRIEAEFCSLDEVLRGLAAVGELTPRISDMVVSMGERLSSRMIAEAFRHRELDAVYVDARQCIVTDGQHGKAIPQDALIEQRLKQHVLPHASAARVCVMGGFIGATEKGVTTTLGRGGSDFTAALVGGGLDADSIEIWTDVNGIMTTDPRICPKALRVKTISFEEAAELAYFGAKVLHPATILPAVKKNIPVLVLNSKNPQNEGTKIISLAPHCRSPFKSIAAKRRLTIIDVVASRMLMSHGYLKAIFDVFDKHKCPVDMVSTSEVSVSLTVDSNDKLPDIAADLSQLADVKYEGRKALICMVGEDIRGRNGIAARVFQAIRHVNVRMISQGASEINMSFMIEDDDVEEAIRSLHAEFFDDPDPEIFDVEALSEIDGEIPFVKPHELVIRLGYAEDDRTSEWEELRNKVEAIARSTGSRVWHQADVAGGTGTAVITGSTAGSESSSIVVGLLASVGPILGTVLGAWLQAKIGRRVRLKIGSDGLEAEANTSEELHKLLEEARQVRKDLQAKVIVKP